MELPGCVALKKVEHRQHGTSEYEGVKGKLSVTDIALEFMRLETLPKQPAFTHVFWEDYCRLKAILCGEHRTRNDRVLGYAVYTEAIASLGKQQMPLNTKSA